MRTLFFAIVIMCVSCNASKQSVTIEVNSSDSPVLFFVETDSSCNNRHSVNVSNGVGKIKNVDILSQWTDVKVKLNGTDIQLSLGVSDEDVGLRYWLVRRDDDCVWFFIGTHGQYGDLIGGKSRVLAHRTLHFLGQ